jgi:hypothetical protein
MTWYHATGIPQSEAILSDGFRTVMTDWTFKELFDNVASLLPRESQRELYEVTGDTYPIPPPKRMVDALKRLWNKDYGAGTVIWVSREPFEGYGEVLMEVDLPSSAKKIGEDGQGGVAFYVPKESISPSRFKVVE